MGATVSVLLNGDTNRPDCPHCGGLEPSEDQVGHGWIEAPVSNVVLPQPDENGDPVYVAPQLTVQPCSGCRVTTARRWRRGHYPCPQRDRRTQKPCRACLRDLGLAEQTDTEMMPGNDGPMPPPPEEPPPTAEQQQMAEVIRGEFGVD